MISSPFRFIRELRRRRVPQVLAVYLVVGFGMLEAADMAFPRLGLPDWTVTLVLALLILGLPLVFFLAWFYDVRGGTVERTPELDSRSGAGVESISRDAEFERGVLALGAGIVLLAVAAWAVGSGVLNEGPVLRDELVVVLPFRATGEAEGMLDLMAAKLTGEGGLRAVEPRTVLAAWRQVSGPDGGEGAEASRHVARTLDSASA